MDGQGASNPSKIYSLPNGAHEDCLICEGQFPSVKTKPRVVVGDEFAQALISAQLSKTRENIQHVRDILHSHDDLILARWKKYSPRKRSELLTKASPVVFHIPPPEFLDKLNTSNDGANLYASWLDVAEFAEDRMRLMSLLHVRCEYGPEQWAAFDTRSAWLACRTQTGWQRCIYNSNPVVMHGEHYGKLVPFFVNSAHSWQEVGFPHADVTCWVQVQISAGLAAVVDMIIDGGKPRGNAKWTAFLSKGLRGAYEEALWGSYYHQEFTPPSQFDPKVISEKARNHLNMLMDEMELTQTDPKHMYQQALELKKDTFVSEDEKKTGGEWTKTTRAIASKRMSDLMRWRQVVQEADKLGKAIMEYRSKGPSEACLDRDADTAVKSFGRVISHMLKTLVQEEGTPMLETVAIMRSRWLQEEGCEKYVPLGHEQCDRINRTVMKTGFTLENEYPDGISWFLLEMRHEMRDITYNKDVENWLSGMALLDEIHTLWRWRQISCHRGLDVAEPPILEVSRAYLKVPRSSYRLTAADVGRLQECSESLWTFCKIFPKNALRGSSSPKQMIKAHDHLSKFWEYARKAWDLQVEDGNSGVSKSDVLSLMSFDVSPDYLDKIEAMRLQCEDGDCHDMTHKNEKSITHFVQQPWDMCSGDDGAVRRNLPKKSNASRNDTLVRDEDKLQMTELGQALVDDGDAASAWPSSVSNVPC